MQQKESLTNEFVKKKFKSQFDLVNYAIRLSEQMIRSGRAPSTTTDSENAAVIIIEEIVEGKDKLEEISLKEAAIEIQELKERSEAPSAPSLKSTEKKKTRRILV